MDELRVLEKAQRKQAYNEVLREAFPRTELKPLSAIERGIRDGYYVCYGLFRDGVPVGYVFNMQIENYVLVDYLCVPKHIRCGGIGSRTLELMMAQYPDDTVFIGETEAEVGDPERDALILRRQALYRRLGARYLPYDTALFGVRYKTIAWAKQPVCTEAVQRFHAEFYRRTLPGVVFRAAIRIPLLPGDVLEEQDWSALEGED